MPVVDSGFYEAKAAAIAEKPLSAVFLIDRSNITPTELVMALVYKITGRSLVAARIVQAFFGAVNCVLIYILGVFVFGNAAGMIAGVLSVFYWPFIAFGAMFLPDNTGLTSFLIFTIFYLLYFRQRKLVYVLMSSVFLGLTFFSRGHAILFFPVSAALLFFDGKIKLPQKLLNAAVFSTGFLAALLPLFFCVGGKSAFSVPQKNLGLSAFVGSRLDNMDVIKPGPFSERFLSDLGAREPESVSAPNIFWLRKTFLNFVSAPAVYFKNIAYKLYIILNGYEFSPEENINYIRSKSLLLLICVGFGVVFPLAVAGFILFQGKSFIVKVIMIFFITYIVSMLPFCPNSRYRLLIVPFVLICAGAGIVGLYRSLIDSEMYRTTVFICVTFAVYFSVNTNSLYDRLERIERPLYHEAMVRSSLGDKAGAVADLYAELMRNPGDPDVYYALGEVYDSIGDRERSFLCFQNAEIRAGVQKKQLLQCIGENT